jgi:hypothetical protein
MLEVNHLISLSHLIIFQLSSESTSFDPEYVCSDLLGMTAKHVKDLFMATTKGLIQFADRLENSMSGPSWSDDTTFKAAFKMKAPGPTKKMDTPIGGLNIGKSVVIISRMFF